MEHYTQQCVEFLLSNFIITKLKLQKTKYSPKNPLIIIALHKNILPFQCILENFRIMDDQMQQLINVVIDKPLGSLTLQEACKKSFTQKGQQIMNQIMIVVSQERMKRISNMNNNKPLN